MTKVQLPEGEITVWGVRKKPYEVFSDCPMRHGENIVKALCTLVKYELGYGGRVVEASETRLVTNTNILGSQDTTYFEGTPEAMRPLIEAAYYYEMVLRDHKDPWWRAPSRGWGSTRVCPSSWPTSDPS